MQKRRPAHQASAACRQRDLTPLRQVCRECTWLGKPRDLCAGALVASDGRTCKAVNATERHFTRDTLQRLLEPSNPRAEDALAARDRRDDPDAGPPGGATADNGPATSEALQHRQRRAAGCQARLAGSGAAQRPRTAPASRAMQLGHGRGPAVCARAQTAVDAQHKRLLARDAASEPGDRDGLRPMAPQANAGRGGPCAAVADVG